MAVVLLTGGAGFIGSHLQDRLIEIGHEVVVLDNLSTGKKSNLNSKATFREIDLLDRVKLSKLVAKISPEIIYHLAAFSSVKESVKNPAKCHQINLVGGYNLLEAATKCEKLRSFIFASSAAVYGDLPVKLLPIEESIDGKPLSDYGLTKKVFEDYVAYFSSKYGFSGVSLRKSNVYGPRQSSKSEGGVVSIFSSRLKKTLPTIIYGDGSNTRDYVYVKDVVEAYIKAAKYRKSGVFNISTCQEVSNLKLHKLIAKILEIDATPVFEDFRTGDIYRSCLDNSLAKKCLSWQPEYSLEDGLSDMLRR